MVTLSSQLSNDPRRECGFYRHRPKNLPVFNSMRSFMAFFTLLLIAYGMASSYTSSVLPSVEKRFGFSSKTMGSILAVCDAGIVIMALITAHFAGKGSRPRGIFIGSFCCGFAILLLAVPELFFPYTRPNNLGEQVVPTSDHKETLCSAENQVQIQPNATVCANEQNGNVGAFVVFAIAEFLLGMGSTCFMILGLPFIDDNVSLADAPLYFGISFAGRIFGPMLGFGLGSISNNIFYNWSTPPFKQTDPRWISAWYFGFVIIGAAVLFFALFIGCFPAEIASTTNCKQPGLNVGDINKESAPASASVLEMCDSSSSWQEFLTNSKCLLLNLPFMCRAASNALDGMIITGFLSFFFKFIGQQYLISPAVASLVGGVPTIFGIALGVLGGALLIKRFSLQPREICLMLVISAIILCAAILLSIELGCERTEILGLEGSEALYAKYDSKFNGSFCASSMNCSCSMAQFTPVCDHHSGVNFYSPCHAGCQSSRIINDVQYYDGCSCVKSAELYDDVDTVYKNERMRGGFCWKECSNVYIFIALFFLAMVCLGLPLAGSIMVQYRLVEPDLKSLSTGFILLLTAAIGYLPAPIFFGAIVDTTCRLWETSSCGGQNFCLLYDTDEFRWKFMVTAASIKGIGVILDSIVTYWMWNITFARPEAISANNSVSPLFVTASSRQQDDLMAEKTMVADVFHKNELILECPESKL